MSVASTCRSIPGSRPSGPRDAVRKGYGRVRFGHSELTGLQLWDTACDEGERAVRQVMEIG